MIFLRSCLAAAWLNLASLRKRLWASLVMVAGVACVVATLLSMLTVTSSLRHAWQRAGSPDRAIILPAGTQAEGNGTIGPAQVAILKDAPGIARDAKGRAIADAEILTGLDARRRDTGGHGYIMMRSFGPRRRPFDRSSISCRGACIAPASAN